MRAKAFLRRRIVVAVVAAAAVMTVAVAAAVGWGYYRFTRAGPLAAAKVLVVPKGSDVEAISADLAAAGIIDDWLLFTLGVRLAGAAGVLRAGEFRFPAAISQRSVMKLLVEGKSVLRRLTVAEGLTTAQVVAQLAAAEGLEGEVTAAAGEGTLLPETYYYVYGAARDQIVARMGSAMTRTLDELWQRRVPGLPFASREEALILASIVEKETSLDSERRRIAGVFVNRLRTRLRLQSDPTVIYAITHGTGPLGRRLTTQDLATPSPYNTYVNVGLPPGPIANPGRESIAAALDPLVTGELFFVADGSGGHAFAATLEEHNRNVARWRKIRRGRRGR